MLASILSYISATTEECIKDTICCQILVLPADSPSCSYSGRKSECWLYVFQAFYMPDQIGDSLTFAKVIWTFKEQIWQQLNPIHVYLSTVCWAFWALFYAPGIQVGAETWMPWFLAVMWRAGIERCMRHKPLAIAVLSNFLVKFN